MVEVKITILKKFKDKIWDKKIWDFP